MDTAEEEALSHRQLVDAGNGIKQLYHRMFQSCNTTSACEGEILESTAVSQTPAASPFGAEPPYCESDEVRSEVARELAGRPYWRKRTLFTTHQGYLGLGPLSTQVDDHARLRFGDVPYILRPKERGARSTYFHWGGICLWLDGWRNNEQKRDQSDYRRVHSRLDGIVADTNKSQAPQRPGQWISSNVVFSEGYEVKGLSLSPRHLAGPSVL